MWEMGLAGASSHGTGAPEVHRDSQDLAFLGGSWFLDGEASERGLGGLFLVPGPEQLSLPIFAH